MKILTLVFVPVLAIAVACGDNSEDPIEMTKLASPACSVDNPIEELQWLKEYIKARKEEDFTGGIAISQGKYNGEDVFVVSCSCPQCNSINIVFDCQGNEIGLGAGSEIEHLALIWHFTKTGCDP